MNERLAIIIGAGLVGAAIGAAVTGVGWAFWAFWALTWFSLVRLVHRERREHAGAQ